MASSWYAKKMTINFNQKQWRQDLAEYLRRRLFWDGTTRVTRTKKTATYKQFEVYDQFGGEVVIRYQHDNQVVHTTHQTLIDDYFKERSVN